MWVTADGAIPLEKLQLKPKPGAGDSSYDEAWLQRLLFDRPEILPVEQIEPGFGRLVSVCRELPLQFGAGRSGALDNLFVTADGGLVLVEAKLWRNPEARRSVVAQAMEYAAAVFRMSYAELDAAAAEARHAGGASAASLYALAGAQSELDEAGFVDAVTRNLRRGRAIVAVVGDGIREDILPLAELLQSHAGQRFSFALIELGIYAAPHGGAKLVLPSVLARTELIERGVVRIEDGLDGAALRVVVAAPAPPGPLAPRSFGITEDEFMERLASVNPQAPALLRALLDKAATLGTYVEFQAGLNLKHQAHSGKPINLASIRKDGSVDTGASAWFGRERAGEAYNRRLAGLIGGHVTHPSSGVGGWVKSAADKLPKLWEFLPQHEDAWVEAMKAYLDCVLSDHRNT